jgi:hypothetical protein
MSDEFTHIMDFEPRFADLCPETCAMLRCANLVVHPFVSKVVLHGSRGLAGGYRTASDIDFSLIVDMPDCAVTDSLLDGITRTTLDQWQAAIDLDLAVIYDQKKCGLKCFAQTSWQQDFCQVGGLDCFGLYKIQKGFHGFVSNAGIQVKLMYPCLIIWKRGGSNP